MAVSFFVGRRHHQRRKGFVALCSCFITETLADQPCSFSSRFPDGFRSRSSFFSIYAPSSDVFEEFLRQKCGFSATETLKINKRRYRFLKYSSTQLWEQVVQFLRDSGLTPLQVRKCILKCPRILSRSVDVDLKPHFRLLSSLGLSRQELAKVATQIPASFSPKSAENMLSKLQYLENLVGGKAAILKTVRSHPAVLLRRLESSVKIVECLQKSGIQDQWLVHLVSKHSRVFQRTPHFLESRIADLKSLNMEVEIPSKSFLRIFEAIVSVGSLEQLKHKFSVLAESGLSYQEINQIFCKHPQCFKQSLDKLKGNVDFIVNEARLPVNAVAANPVLLALSLEKRLRPRYQVLEFLVEMKQLGPGFKLASHHFLISNNRFMERHVNGKPYGEQVLQMLKK